MRQTLELANVLAGRGPSTVQDGPGLGESSTKGVWRPRPAWCLWGSRRETGGLLSRWIGNGGGNEEGQVGRTDPMFYLQTLRRPLPLLIMGFVIDPLTKEKLFFRGQFHLAVRLQHTCTPRRAHACPAA
jgi:hypothetical protein